MSSTGAFDGDLGAAPRQGAAPSGSQPADRPRVLVTYASRKGATEGVARRIAAGLARHGITADLRPVEQVRDADAYDAIVYGGAVYNQAWPQEGRDFVLRNLNVLRRTATWLFSVGSFGDDRRLFGSAVRREPKGIEQLQARIDSQDYRVFAGVVDAAQWPWFGRLFFRALGGRFGDNRDWQAIDAWTRGIADSLAQDGVPAM